MNKNFKFPKYDVNNEQKNSQEGYSNRLSGRNILMAMIGLAESHESDEENSNSSDMTKKL